ncbi:YpmS family protein [Ureibacillus composti]|nr:YpmS family protein [Ureibacillus composti]
MIALNIWKVAFFVLAGALISFVILIVVWATSPTEKVSETVPKEMSTNGRSSTLLVETTAKDFEKIAMKYLDEELNSSPLPVEFVVNEQIELYSELIVFGVSVPIQMNFDPIVNEDGNIRLKQTSVNVGKLNIPPTTVLKLMDDAIAFPSWITVRPNNEEIFVDLSNLHISSNSTVKAKEIDLANDRILLEVIVPNE